MMCLITSVVYVLADLDVQEFWKKHLGMYGNSYVNHDGSVDDDWVRGVIDDALRIIGGEKQ